RARRLCPAAERRDPQSGDAVAIAAQHLKPEAVEREALARLRDRAGLVNDEPGDGSGFLVRQIPIHGTVEVADRDPAIDRDGAVELRLDARHRNVVLVLDVADDLLENILERDETHDLAVLVDHEREWTLATAKGLELFGEGSGIGHEPGRQRNRSEVHAREVASRGLNGAQQV